MAFHRLIVVASLPANFPTLPNMTEQAALTRVNLGQQTLMKCHGWLSFEWAGGWVGKGETILGFDKKGFASPATRSITSVVTVCAGSDQLQDAMVGAPRVVVLSFFFECMAHALNRRAAFLFHVETCIFPRDKTG
jgi:hypothetical protein